MSVAKRPITIQDIADKANVSISTVSRVLNGNKKVGEGYKTAVLQAIEELNYQPNFFAQGLAGGASRTIGVITHNVGSPVYDTILKGILQSLPPLNYAPLFADGQWQAEREAQAIHTLIAKRVDGLIVVGGAMPDEQFVQLSQQIPLILVARTVEALKSNCIYLDNFKAAYDATSYLIELGHTRIAHVAGISTHQDAIERQAGYEQALRNAGLPVDPALIVAGDFRRKSGVTAVETLIERGVQFTAVFSANDQLAFGVRLALFHKGLRVPEDVSLIGFDDQSDSAFMIPPLTTVRQPSFEMGKASACAIVSCLQADDSPHFQNQFHGELIVRESTRQI